MESLRSSGDFRELLSLFNAEEVRDLIVGGFAHAHYSYRDFSEADVVFQVGVEPLRIDLLTDITGVEFKEAWPRREGSAYGVVPVQVIGKDDYIANKRARGRPSDLRDIEALLED